MDWDSELAIVRKLSLSEKMKNDRLNDSDRNVRKSLIQSSSFMRCINAMYFDSVVVNFIGAPIEIAVCNIGNGQA